MLVKIKTAGREVVWLCATAMAVFASRYFFPGLLRPPETQLLARHSLWAPLHIGAAAIAIATGPFQFVVALRDRRPLLHRGFGYVYVAAVLLSGLAGLRLAPDTATFFSQSMNDAASATTFGNSFGNLTRLAGYHASDSFTAKELWPVVPSFFLLSLAWLGTTAMALWRARQRRLELHRAWMIRSYSLTFGAITVRALAFPLALLWQSPPFAAIAAACSWPLNLAIAGSVIRSGRTVPIENGAGNGARVEDGGLTQSRPRPNA